MSRDAGRQEGGRNSKPKVFSTLVDLYSSPSSSYSFDLHEIRLSTSHFICSRVSTIAHRLKSTSCSDQSRPHPSGCTLFSPFRDPNNGTHPTEKVSVKTWFTGLVTTAALKSSVSFTTHGEKNAVRNAIVWDLINHCLHDFRDATLKRCPWKSSHKICREVHFANLYSGPQYLDRETGKIRCHFPPHHPPRCPQKRTTKTTRLIMYIRSQSINWWKR